MRNDKPKIKCDFVDFWPGFSKYDNYFISILSEYYDIEINDCPEYLIYSVFGQKHMEYDCTKVLYTGENLRPSFAHCDFAFSFDYLDDTRHQRLPLYALYTNSKSLSDCIVDVDREHLGKNKFCCMLVSNPNCAERNEFFSELSKYKRVDSGGRYLNNIGGPIPFVSGTNNKQKLDFIGQYKFVFAFENSSYPGYTTEKIIEPFLTNSIPIYWGNPLIHLEFNEGSFINCHRFRSLHEAVERIIEIDNDDNLYREMVAAHKLPLHLRSRFAHEDGVIDHFHRIFQSAKPFSVRRFIESRMTRGRRKCGRIKQSILTVLR